MRAVLSGVRLHTTPMPCCSPQPSDQGGSFHLNEQWPTYWSALFADAGMECFDVLRPLVWSDDRIEHYYRQNVLLFAREGVASRLRVRGLDSSVPMDAAHRELFERTVHDLNHRSVRHELRRLKEALRAAVDRRVP